MSNTAMLPLVKSYPVFEPNQVLTNDHLNELFDYLNHEEKETRVKAIGTGILSGLFLEVLNNLAIKISSGAGITADGYLLVTDENSSGLFTKCIPYPPVIPELEISGTTFWELLPEGFEEQGNESTLITDVLEMSVVKAVILYLEEKELDIKSCFTSNCDDRGKQRYFTLKPILVSIPEASLTDASSFQTSHVFPDINIRQIQIPAIANADLPGLYYSVCHNSLLQVLQNSIIDTLYRYRTLMGNQSLTKEILLTEINLITIRESLYTNHRHHMQYFYDFVTDIIRAYNELQHAIHDIDSLMWITESSKKFISLGNIGKKYTPLERHTFRKIIPDYGEVEKKLLAKFLLNRIYKLMLSFKVPVEKTTLSITPSPNYNSNLEDRPIPFYYSLLESTHLYRFWNQHLSTHNKSYQILSYHNSVYNKNPDDQHSQPLKYYHLDKLFLRIEGHVGKPKSLVIDQLITLQKKFCLAFDIMAVRILTDSEASTANDNKIVSNTLPLKEYNIDEFIEKHPGAIHASGVAKGGTFIILFKAAANEVDGEVIGDLSLPYSCACSTQAPPIFQLKAIDDNINTDTNSSIDINVLSNDFFDDKAPIGLDFVFPEFVDDAVTTSINSQVDIHIIKSASTGDEDSISIDFKS